MKNKTETILIIQYCKQFNILFNLIIKINLFDKLNLLFTNYLYVTINCIKILDNQ
jgi:hypothetical protein